MTRSVDQEICMLAQLDAAERMRDEDASCSLDSSNEGEGRREERAPHVTPIVCFRIAEFGVVRRSKLVKRPIPKDQGAAWPIHTDLYTFRVGRSSASVAI